MLRISKARQSSVTVASSCWIKEESPSLLGLTEGGLSFNSDPTLVKSLHFLWQSRWLKRLYFYATCTVVWLRLGVWISSESRIRIAFTTKHWFGTLEPDPHQQSRRAPCKAAGRSAVALLLDATHWLEALYQVLKTSTLIGKYFSFTYLYSFLKKTKYFNCMWS